MPNQPKTPGRSLRIDDELWQAAQETARERGEDVSAVVRASLRRYVARHRKAKTR